MKKIDSNILGSFVLFSLLITLPEKLLYLCVNRLKLIEPINKKYII